MLMTGVLLAAAPGPAAPFVVPPSPAGRMCPRRPLPLFSAASPPPAPDAAPAGTGAPAAGRSPRAVARVEKFARLPVWPAWNGVALFLLSLVPGIGPSLAASLEDAVGGRVCPNFFESGATSPFVMLVHHRHSFAPWDPLRRFQSTFFPEGFPAHPHRGFITVTYVLKGGFRHRDSMGVKQYYGAQPRHGGRHTQWLTTGAGLLHEEMWDIAPDGSDGDGKEGAWPGPLSSLQPSSQELYQLWLNVPAANKMDPPKVELLGGPDGSAPAVRGEGTETVVLAGDHGGRRGSVGLLSDLAILHVAMEAGSTWRHLLPASHQTAILYVRRGSVTVGATEVPAHHTAFLREDGADLTVVAGEGGEGEGEGGADFLLLAGEPLGEPVAAQGSMVLNTPDQVSRAYEDYQALRMGAPWDEGLTDEGWREHVARYPSKYGIGTGEGDGAERGGAGRE